MKEGTKLKTASLVVLSALCISAASLGFAAGANVQEGKRLYRPGKTSAR